MFSEDHPDLWLLNVDLYFMFHPYPLEIRFHIIAMYLEGKALTWFRLWEHQLDSWDKFKEVFQFQFSEHKSGHISDSTAPVIESTTVDVSSVQVEQTTIKSEYSCPPSEESLLDRGPGSTRNYAAMVIDQQVTLTSEQAIPPRVDLWSGFTTTPVVAASTRCEHTTTLVDGSTSNSKVISKDDSAPASVKIFGVDLTIAATVMAKSGFPCATQENSLPREIRIRSDSFNYFDHYSALCPIAIVPGPALVATHHLFDKMPKPHNDYFDSHCMQLIPHSLDWKVFRSLFTKSETRLFEFHDIIKKQFDPGIVHVVAIWDSLVLILNHDYLNFSNPVTRGSVLHLAIDNWLPCSSLPNYGTDTHCLRKFHRCPCLTEIYNQMMGIASASSVGIALAVASSEHGHQVVYMSDCVVNSLFLNSVLSKFDSFSENTNQLFNQMHERKLLDKMHEKQFMQIYVDVCFENQVLNGLHEMVIKLFDPGITNVVDMLAIEDFYEHTIGVTELSYLGHAISKASHDWFARRSHLLVVCSVTCSLNALTEIEASYLLAALLNHSRITTLLNAIAELKCYVPAVVGLIVAKCHHVLVVVQDDYTNMIHSEIPSAWHQIAIISLKQATLDQLQFNTSQEGIPVFNDTRHYEALTLESSLLCLHEGTLLQSSMLPQVQFPLATIFHLLKPWPFIPLMVADSFLLVTCTGAAHVPFDPGETAKKVVPAGSRSALKRGSRKVDSGGKSNPAVVSSSLPVNIPDWSKILKQGYKENRGIDEYAVGDDQDGGSQLPPHEYLARARGASFSVHEGKGRTLKGRDLRSVRNAIWKKVGFED